jgi:fructose-specific phosphotransferase system IIC component
MECEPAASAEVAKDAVPLVTVPCPIVVVPSLKVTVPVASVGTVAVKVTDWVYVDGFFDDVSETVGVALLTVCVMVIEVVCAVAVKAEARPTHESTSKYKSLRGIVCP